MMCASGERVQAFKRNDQRIKSSYFSPDGTRLAAAVGNGTLREYILPLDELTELAHTRLTHTLSDAECRQYLHIETCPAG